MNRRCMSWGGVFFLFLCAGGEGFGQEVKTLRAHADRVSSVAFSPDGTRFASGSEDGVVKVWNTEGWTERWSTQNEVGSIMVPVAFSRDGTILASADTSPDRITLWNADNGQKIRKFKASLRLAYSLEFSPDGDLLAEAGDGGAALWDYESGQCETEIRDGVRFMEAYSAANVVFSAEGDTLFVPAESIKVMDVKTKDIVREFRQPARPYWIGGVAVSADGKLLASCYIWREKPRSQKLEREIVLRDLETGKKRWSVTDKTHIGRSLLRIRFSPDASILASADGEEGQWITLWDVESGDRRQTLKGHLDTVTGLAFSPDGKTLASCSVDKTIRLWTLPAEKR